MVRVTKWIWIIAVALNAIALLYFLIGTTAFFNRAVGTSWGFYFMIIGFPVAILIVISILCLIFKRTPNIVAIVVISAFVTFLTLFTAPLPIETEGWLTERVWTLRHSPSSDILVQTTEDGKYEYFLEVINSGQRNSSARLFVRCIDTGEETRITLDFRNERIGVRTSHTPNRTVAWSFLTVSEISESIYILTTTRNLNDNIEIFEINMETGTSRWIDNR